MLTRCAVSSVHIRRRRMKGRRAIGVVPCLMAVTVVALAACGSGNDEPAHARDALTVVAIDRTGVAASETWSTEVAAQVASEVDQAIGDGVDLIEIIGIGSTPNDTVRWATVDLTEIEGNTRAKREAARDQLVTAAGAAAHELADTPVTTYGTDVVAALSEAAALCQGPDVGSCSILLVSDLEDQRVTRAASTAAAVEALTPIMPELAGIPVHVTGLGASGADSTIVTRVQKAWDALLHSAGAIDVRIARSL
jgi:hypothetical protein